LCFFALGQNLPSCFEQMLVFTAEILFQLITSSRV